ncbi:hypothetical protein DFH01_15925 [Falsiroseomonas bella]|uniref:Uncharacterized protein n=2 Tax=Falsiroseomonas bella TaxID=2184016 RepID=A0A317FCP8_9PROT|nr:hypothetical protein DFH01_15925 [Falsiroseomonas bella]
MVDGVVESTLSSDQAHCVLWLRELDTGLFTLGMPVAQLPPAIEHFARLLAESAQGGQDIRSKLIGTDGVFRARWCNGHDDADGNFVLVLALESGGRLAFALSAAATAALKDSLCGTGHRAAPAPREDLQFTP